MYNQEIKERFFRYCNEKAKSESTILKASALFRRTEPLEEREGKDICAISEGALSAAVSGDMLKGRSFYTMFSILRQYARWCMESGVPGSSNSILNVSVPGLDAVRSRRVFNEIDLKRRLDEVYPEEKTGSANELFLMFAWLAWAQVPVGDTVKIKKDQVNLRSLSISAEGKNHVLSRYARHTAEFLVTSDSFTTSNPNAVLASVRRKESEILLSGIKGVKTVGMMNRQFAIDFTNARNEGRTESALTYAGISESSMFYDIYKFESAGIDPDETITVNEQGKGASREDYEQWKLAFVRI